MLRLRLARVYIQYNREMIRIICTAIFFVFMINKSIANIFPYRISNQNVVYH